MEREILCLALCRQCDVGWRENYYAMECVDNMT